LSDKIRFDLAFAQGVAEEFAQLLAPMCKRIQIAGSIRRQKPLVGDIEILFVPQIARQRNPHDMFSDLEIDLADSKISALLKDGRIEKRQNINGQFTWGPKNKLATDKRSGIPIDFFATTEENWWVSLVIRTGSKETNLTLTNGAIKLGRNLTAYGCGVRYSDNSIGAAHSEQAVFEMCGVPYKEPQDR
jgi:DNA polymerase/3'-5' exonuclease PolX